MNREAEAHGSATEASMVLAVSFRNSASYCLFSSSIKDRQSGGLFDAHGHQKRRTRGVVEDTVREAKPCRARSRRSQKSTAPSAPAWLLGSSSGWRRGAGRLNGRRRRGVRWCRYGSRTLSASTAVHAMLHQHDKAVRPMRGRTGMACAGAAMGAISREPMRQRYLLHMIGG